jgi:hypothetical protein
LQRPANAADSVVLVGPADEDLEARAVQDDVDLGVAPEAEAVDSADLEVPEGEVLVALEVQEASRTSRLHTTTTH